MAKKVFVPGQTSITATDMNRLETLRADVFDEATTKEGARIAIGASPIVHAHSVATPSTNGFGGSQGFISAPDMEKLRTISTYPATTSSSASGSFVIPMIADNGSIIFMTVAALQSVFGSGGGPPPTPVGEVNGGESETTSFAVEANGGESDTAVFTIEIDGGEA